MKKISIAIAALTLMVGVACGGGSSWSEADKAELKTGLNIGVEMDVLTRTQADCMSDWMQSRYDSLEAANADGETNKKAQQDLMSKCDLDPKYFNENEVEVEIDEPLVIEREETKTNAATKSLCNEALATIGTGLDHIASGANSLPYVDVDTANEFISTAIDFVAESLNTVELCTDVMPEISELRDPLVDLRTNLVDAIR